MSGDEKKGCKRLIVLREEMVMMRQEEGGWGESQKRL